MKKMLAHLAFGMMACSAAMAMGCGGVEDGGAPLERLESVEAAVAEYNLSGSWRGPSSDAAITQNGSSLTAYIPGRPPAYGYYTGSNTIFVSFSDETGCCNGFISGDGNSIAWSNGTTWRR